MALGKIATQSSEYDVVNYHAGKAVDGNTDGNYYYNSVQHTLNDSLRASVNILMPGGVIGQFVQVKLNNGGGDNYLQMAEVQVFGDVADASGVPEPATMGLTAGAFAVAALIRRKLA